MLKANLTAPFTIEMQEANEANQIRDLNRELDHGVPLDYWWMDAGWYPFTSGWPDVGTWEPDPARFPRGFAPISKLAHERGGVAVGQRAAPQPLRHLARARPHPAAIHKAHRGLQPHHHHRAGRNRVTV